MKSTKNEPRGGRLKAARSIRFVVPFFSMVLSQTMYAATVLTLQVSDLQDRPVVGVVVSAKDSATSTSAPTDKAGKTQIVFAKDLQPGQDVVLVLVKAPSKKLRFFSPWEGSATVPTSDRAIAIVLGVLGDQAALVNPNVVGTLANAVARRVQLSATNGHTSPASTMDALSSVARECQLNPVQVDKAIRGLASGTGIFNSVDKSLGYSAQRYVDVVPRDFVYHGVPSA
jgi:hypothetical protein